MIKGKYYGIGYNDGKYPSKINYKNDTVYDLWHNMLKRCYCESTKNRQPTYSQCLMSDNFKNYSYLYEWCYKQKGFDNAGWQLDKDILIKGNKIYSEDICVFVPRSINNLFLKCNSIRGEYPVGVCFNKRERKFVSYVYIDGARKHLGYFNSLESAFAAYKVAKENNIHRLAEEYKTSIDRRVYEALISYQVEIGD